jgi:hypothetical protein
MLRVVEDVVVLVAGAREVAAHKALHMLRMYIVVSVIYNTCV